MTKLILAQFQGPVFVHASSVTLMVETPEQNIAVIKVIHINIKHLCFPKMLNCWLCFTTRKGH